MRKFHTVSWEERAAMFGKFKDDRYNRIAALVVYSEKPEALPEDGREAINEWLAGRLLATEKTTQRHEEMAHRFLKATWEEKVGMVGQFEGVEGRVNFGDFNAVALIAFAEAPDDAREDYIENLRKYLEHSGPETANKFVGTYKTRYLKAAKDRETYAQPKSEAGLPDHQQGFRRCHVLQI